MLDAVESIFSECFRTFSALPNGALIERPGMFGVVNDAPVGFFNGIGHSRFDANADERIDETMAIFRERKRSFRWWISPSTMPDDMPMRLRRRGFRHVYDSTGMAADLHATAVDTAAPSSLDIRRITAAEGLERWAAILLGVFARPPHENVFWIDAYSRLGFDGPWTHYLGYLDGHAVATSSVLVAGELAGVYHVATLPEARGRGFGSAMTMATMRRARASGASTIVLQSSEMGESVYRGLGFSRVCDLTLYDWTAVTR
jgi:ribosomal protein S18 acetylase RimI-like enzyme